MLFDRRILMIVCIICTLLVSANFIRGWGQKDSFIAETYDRILSYKKRAEPNDIVIIAIDDESLAAMGRWPWPRTFHAALFQNLTDANVKGIALDLFFPEVEDIETDNLLKQRIAANGKTVLPSVRLETDKGPTSMPPLGNAAAAIGFSETYPDQDGVVRSTRLWASAKTGNDKNIYIPSLPLALLQITSPKVAANYPQDSNETYLIPYLGEPGSIHKISYSQVISGEIPLPDLEGKYVFIGMTATGQGPTFPTPIGGRQFGMSGIELQAQTFDGLRKHLMISIAPQLVRQVTQIVVIALSVAVICLIPPLMGVALAVLINLLALGLSTVLLWQFSIWLPLEQLIAIPIFSIVWALFSIHLRLREINLTLEHRVAERTQELSEANLALEHEVEVRGIIADTLQDRELHLRTLLDGLSSAVLMLDRTGQVISCSQPFQVLFGFRSEDTLGRPITNFFAPDDKSGTQISDLGKVLMELANSREQDNCELEFRGIRSDGETFPVSVAINSLSQRGEQHYVCLIRDITEQRRAERATNEFIATVSHELRTPLTSVKGALGLLAGGIAGQLPAEAGKLIDIASRNSERLLLLVNDILDIQKIQVGALDFQMEQIDLVDLVKQSLEVNAHYARNYGSTYLLDAEPGYPCWIYGDQRRLTQVITNLLSNAAKFSPENSVISVSILPQERNQVRVSVCDQGPGIPEEFLSRLFQRFAQAQESKHRSHGTGLGLNISKMLIERMHGTIGYEPAPIQGACFYFVLPLMDD